MNKSIVLDDRHSMSITRNGDQMHVDVIGPDKNIGAVAIRSFLAAIDACKFAITIGYRDFAPVTSPTPLMPPTITISDDFRADMNKEPAPPTEVDMERGPEREFNRGE